MLEIIIMEALAVIGNEKNQECDHRNEWLKESGRQHN